LKDLQFKANSWSFDFIKNSAQILNNFLKNGKMKNNLIYAKSVQVLP
jgi:hypothetical protein